MAYSLTTSYQSYLGTSPVPVRPSSLSRTVSGRGLGTGVSPKFSSSPYLFPTASDAFSLSEDTNRKSGAFPVPSTSTAFRRSVASSPTVSPEPFSVTDSSRVNPDAVLNRTVGFEAVQSDSIVPTFSGFGPTKPNLPKPRPPRQQGLLSQAFHANALEVKQAVPAAASEQEAATSSFFPDVDFSPLKKAQETHTVFKSELVTTAYALAARTHAAHTRKNGEPLLSHCLEVACILATIGLDAEAVAAGLLHEVLHDNPAFQYQLEEFMPSSVVQLVECVSKLRQLSQVYRASNFEDDDKFRNMIVKMENVKAVLIQLADRVHNLRTVGVLPADKQESLARETLDVYSVVANRLGVWSLRAELEDLAFSVLHPAEYADLKAKVQKVQDAQAFTRTVDILKAELDKEGIQVEDISGRSKNLYGLWKKMCDKGCGLDAIYDLTAMRVVVTNKTDCYKAHRVIQRCFTTKEKRYKDYIANPKRTNGYQSLHDVIVGEGNQVVEVQIRTHKMHYIAEYGHAAHWRYKEKLNNEDEWNDKETQYKKWLTTYQLKVRDQKVRPSGSPPNDHSLKSLGLELLHTEHSHKVDPFLKLERFKMEIPARRSVSVMVTLQDIAEIRDFPTGTTAQRAATALGVHHLPGYVLTVNGKLVSGTYQLTQADVICVVPEKETMPARVREDRLLEVLALDRTLSVTLPLRERSTVFNALLPDLHMSFSLGAAADGVAV